MADNRASQTSGGLFSTERRDTYPYIDPNKANLKGKNVLITGASRGLGKATAISYAKAGASGIALGARSSLESVVQEVLQAAKDAGHPEPKISAVDLDVTSRESVDAAAKQVSQDLDGRIDILVNNAGYLAELKPIQDMDPDEWWRTFEVNVKGPFLVFHAFYPLLMKSSLKILINVISVGAITTLPHSSAYGPSKLTTFRITEQINQDNGEGKDGIVAIAVHPGGVVTEMAMNLPKHMHAFLPDTAELAGDTLAWLGVERREWMGGRYISANWDMEEVSAKKDEIVKRDLFKMRLAV